MEYKHNILIYPYNMASIQPYLPANYMALASSFLPDDWPTYMDHIDWQLKMPVKDIPSDSTVIIGTDYAGWTVDQYVVPRLASGMYHPAVYGHDQPVLTKAILLNLCNSGFADEQTGDVEAPTGHVMRVGRYLLHTDDRGGVDMRCYVSEQDAREDFASLDDEYSKWASEED